jgi:hypothetical protein
MTKILDVAETRFVVWKYYAGHGTLLMRSHSREGQPDERIFVIFKTVKYIDLCTSFDIDTIEEIDKYSQILDDKIKTSEFNRIFAFKLKNIVLGYIVAGSIGLTRDHRKFGEDTDSAGINHVLRNF